MYEEEMEKVEIDDVIIEEEIPECEERHKKFSDKVKRHWKSFANNPVSGTQKLGLIIGAIMLGGLMEKYHGLRDKELLEEEITFQKTGQNGRSNEAVRMSKREFLKGIGKTHSVEIQSIDKLYSYKEFKKKN